MATGRISAEMECRIELAAFYRIVHREGLTDLIHNHITARVPGTHDHFLMNAFGLDYSEITATNLIKIDLEGNVIGPVPTGTTVNRAGYVIHSAIHGARHDLACIAHTHSSAGVAVATLACGLLPITQAALRFAGDLAYHDYEGPVFRDDEKARLIASLGDCDNMILRNHGVIAAGRSIAHAYVNLMALEAACRIQVAALGCNQPLNPLRPQALREADVVFRAARAAKPGDDYPGPELEWAAALRRLDRTGTDYRD